MPLRREALAPRVAREVFNFQTETANYFAEGILVHNCDLHARHRWLVGQLAFREAMMADPEYFDVKVAGWWVWGLSQWIGGGWCHVTQFKIPNLSSHGGNGTGVHKKMPNTYARGAGNGVHCAIESLPKSRPILSQGTTLHRKRTVPHTSEPTSELASRLPSLGNSRGVHGTEKPPCDEWFAALCDRLRRVRVCCGDWTRVMGDSVLGTTKSRNSGMNPCGVFLDPPYSEGERDAHLYATDSGTVAADVAAWARDHGDDPDLRIALCGYEGEHEMPASWTCHAWKAHRGYAGADNDNKNRERIWFSPFCLPLDAAQGSLFDRVAP